MAKSKPHISLSDVPQGMTLVRSRAYGDHVRAKRGTYKEAKLNAALQKGTVLIGEANAAAKLFKDTIEPYRKDLIQKSLWPTLLSMFRRQQTATGMIDFGMLKPFEIHSRYTLHKLLPVQVVTSFDDNINTLRAVISYEGLPHFSNSRINGYKLRAIVLFPDLKKKIAKTVVQESAILPLKGMHSPFDVAFYVPGKAKCFMLCLRIDGYSTAGEHNTFATKGMRVIAAGAIPR